MASEQDDIVPRTLVNRRNDVDAKHAFIEALEGRGFSAKVTGSPADIPATKSGETYYFEIKFTNQASKYFGAATLTGWEAAFREPTHYSFVTAPRSDDGWVFHEYTPDEFTALSTIPPFKIFFQILVGSERAAALQSKATRSIPVTRDRLVDMVRLFAKRRAASAEPQEYESGGMEGLPDQPADYVGVDGPAPSGPVSRT